MQTAEQILEAIRRLPKEERNRLRADLPAAMADDDPAPVKPKRGERLRALAGCVDLGPQLLPDWNREMLYEDAE